MAVYLPIISEFNGKGIAKAKREFKSLEGAGAKAGYILKKSFLPATAALAGLAATAMKAVDAALEDQKSQVELARVMKATINATQGQINASEEWITTQGRLLGITDDELRPALGKILRVTKDLPKAFKVLALAQDIARGTGKDLGSTTDALAKALGGNMKSLRALAPELTALIKDGASVDEVFKKLGDTFGGAASEYAKTAAGRMEILKLRFSELFETLGYAILPAFEKLMPYFDRLATWLEQNPDKIAEFAKAFGDFAVMAVDLGKAVGNVFIETIKLIQRMINVFIDGINIMIKGLNFLPGVNIGLIDKLAIYGEGSPAAPAKGSTMFGLPSGVQGPTLNSAFKPLASGVQGPFLMPPGGYNNTKGFFGLMGSPTTVNVNVNGGDPRAVVDAIVRWSRQNGRLPPQVQTAY